MNLLARTALTDPATPGPILALLSAGADESVRALLAAHPNTPTTCVPDPDTHPIRYAGPFGAALASPAATEATRARVIRSAADLQLCRLALEGHDHHHAAALELTRRLRADPSRLVAAAVHARTELPAADRALAVHTLLESQEVFEDRDALGYRLAFTATALDEHLPALTARAIEAATSDRGRSRPSAAVHITARELVAVAGHPAPHAAFVASCEERMRAGVDPWRTPESAIAACPDPDFVMAVVEMGVTPGLAQQAITRAAHLIGTPVWRRAKFYDATGHAPHVDDLPEDELTAIATWSNLTPQSRQAFVSSTARLPFHAPADLLSTYASRILADDDFLDMPRALIRVLLHPGTQPADFAALHDKLAGHDQSHVLRLIDPQFEELRTVLLSDDPLGVAIADHPLPALGTIDKASEPYVAVHARTAARALWNDLDAARAAFALAGTFPGTLNELITTATTIAGR